MQYYQKLYFQSLGFPRHIFWKSPNEGESQILKILIVNIQKITSDNKPREYRKKFSSTHAKFYVYKQHLILLSQTLI